ncbi:MAG TPA: carboxypeptidase regulatory-like domain-containing protein [Vicinamibacterales bacterium]|nr:carboxypeptidase regulatory-like domain-containing protein [Vicinamibacterales bacterium]
MTARFYVVVALTLIGLAAPAAAQTGRATGTVRDQNGKPIRSAIIRAENPGGYPKQVTSSSDSKGRWAMIGLAITGEWHFTVEAPGYAPQSVSLPVRSAGTPPLQFVLARDLGPIPGALDKNIQQQVTEASALRDQGRFDQAIAAYQEIRKKNEKLTSIHFLLADTYRRKAAAERDPAARRVLLQQAAASYDELLKSDASNERARAELDSTRAEIALTNPGTN